MKKKLLIFSYNLDLGGIERALINLLNNIDYSKYDIDLFLEENKGIFIKMVNKNVNVIEYKVYKNKIKLIQKIMNFYNQIKFKLKYYNKYDCSILYTPYSYPGNFVVRNASRNRLLFIHSDYSKIYNEIEFKNFFDSRKLEKFNNIIFVSNESCKNFLDYYPNFSDKVHVINNLVDYKNIEEQSKKTIKENFKHTDINLLFAGRLDEESKNISMQLKLIKDLLPEFPNLKLFIVGDGPNKKDYKEYIKENNLCSNVFLLGKKQNPYPYIKKCDYLILTSNYEGYPLVVTEALILKKQVISTVKVSDDTMELGKDYGYVVSKEYLKFKEEVVNILRNKNHKKIQLNFEKINNSRIHKIEELIDGCR